MFAGILSSPFVTIVCFFPLVLLGCTDAVGHFGLDAGLWKVRHLVDQGCSRIAFLALVSICIVPLWIV